MPTEQTWVILFERLGSFALIALMFVYYVHRAAPQQRKDFLEAIKDQRTDFAALHGELVKALMENTRATRELVEQMAMHVGQANAVWRKQGLLTERSE